MKKKTIVYSSIFGGIVLGVALFLILFFNIPRLSYEYNEKEDAYYVSNAYGNAKEYEILETYKGKSVIGIGVRAFYQHSNLERVVLPQSVQTIERLAFSESSNLKEINLEYVETIYTNAFSYCTSLNDIKLLNVKDIGGSAFYKCSSLNTIQLSDDLTSIGSMAFAETNFTGFSVPRSVTELGTDCFYLCTALRNINVYGPNLKNNTYLQSLVIVNYIG